MNDWRIGNKWKTISADARWLSHAVDLGWTNEKEMWKTLIKEWSAGALADLIGYDRSCIFRRLKRWGVKNPRVAGEGSKRWS